MSDRVEAITIPDYAGEFPDAKIGSRLYEINNLEDGIIPYLVVGRITGTDYVLVVRARDRQIGDRAAEVWVAGNHLHANLRSAAEEAVRREIDLLAQYTSELTRWQQHLERRLTDEQLLAAINWEESENE